MAWVPLKQRDKYGPPIITLYGDDSAEGRAIVQVLDVKAICYRLLKASEDVNGEIALQIPYGVIHGADNILMVVQACL